mmetsp:Transcript_7135/g.22036  ORF Transcript_7135/g.22036 Transcript_7135/m.22036 type:complete len:282 (+) Transcript_7135:51-896(+)
MKYTSLARTHAKAPLRVLVHDLHVLLHTTILLTALSSIDLDPWPPSAGMRIFYSRLLPVPPLGKLWSEVARLVPLHKLVQPVLEPRLGIVSELVARVADVGIRGEHVAGRHRHHGTVGLHAKLLFENFDKVEQALAPMVTQIKHLLVSPKRKCRDDTVNDVVDVREVTARLAVPVDLYRQTELDAARERKIGHVRAAPWAIHCEKAQSSDAQAVETMVNMRYRLIGLLGRRVERVWAVNTVGLGKGCLSIGTVHRGGGGVHKRHVRRRAQRLEQRDEALQV